MRVSQGVPQGRKILLYYPELFDEYEEVIIYPQKEFKRNFMTIKEHINYSFLENFRFEMTEKWRIMGYWLSILERVQLIEIGMNQFFSAKTAQSYLDTYIYNEIPHEPYDESYHDKGYDKIFHGIMNRDGEVQNL